MFFGLKIEREAAPNPIVLVGSSQNRFKSCNDVSVELAFDCLGEPKARNPTRHGVAVRPIGGHCVVGIGYSDDPREQRDLLSCNAIGIALTIDALVVMTNDLRNLAVVFDLCKNSLADRRMLLHLPTLVEC